MSATTARGQPAGIAPAAQREDPRPTTPAPPLGLIGLNRAGRAIAIALRDAGLAPRLCDPDPAHRAAYAKAAGDSNPILEDPAELARSCTIVLLALELGADAAAIHGAMLTAMAPGGLIVDLSPALPGDIRRLAAELAPHGLRLMDAAVVAEPKVVLSAGTQADQSQAAPVLRALGELIPTGPVGTAAALSALLAELDAPQSVARIRTLAAQQTAPW